LYLSRFANYLNFSLRRLLEYCFRTVMRSMLVEVIADYGVLSDKKKA